MTSEIIEVLDDLSRRFGVAIDWTSSNMLPYLQTLTRKYANYILATSSLELVVGVLLLIGCAKLVKVYRKIKDGESDWWDEEFYGMFCCIAIGVTFVFGWAMTFDSLLDIITCMTFPEKLILNELLQVLKNQ